MKATKHFSAAVGIIILNLLSLPALAGGAEKPLGTKGETSFMKPTRIGSLLLEPGSYQIQHVVSGSEHFVVFRKMHTNPYGSYTRVGKEAGRVECKLNVLPEPAKYSELHFASADRKVLKELIVQGETFEHVFE